MKFLAGLTAVSVSMMLAACGQTVNVRIYPNLYETDGVKSELATPVVDKVVSLNPSKVVVWVCHNTPHRKTIQFMVELEARSTAQVGGNFFEDGCPV